MDSTVLWNKLSLKSRNLEISIDALERKRTGSYYTNLALTDVMMEELISHLAENDKKITEYRFLEPCVGTGNFVFSYLKMINKRWNLSREEVARVVDNIYVADINRNALDAYKDSLRELVFFYWKLELDEAYFEEHTRSGLLVDVSADKLDYIPLEDPKFDIVVTNPPFKNLKAERGHYGSEREYQKDQEKYSSISQIVSGRFRYSTDGVLNLYKLFVEEIIDKYANENAYVSLLLPAPILSDKTCEKLRSHILCDSKLLSIKVLGEENGHVDAHQALSAMLIKKGSRTSCIRMTKDFCRAPENFTDILLEDILNENTGNAIIAVSEEEYCLLKAFRKFPAVKDLDFLINMRGELDLTANKEYIVSRDTGYRLLRGRNIGYYKLLGSGKEEAVSPEFLEVTQKRCYIGKKRIACQQVVNMRKERRVTFSLVPENCVLGNSCNFIAVKDNAYGIDIYAILGLFNTKRINWLFKLTSSNNHVSNYEIDRFPVPVHAPELKIISLLTQAFLSTGKELLLEEIEKWAACAYGIDQGAGAEEIEKKLLLCRYYNDVCRILPDITLEDAEDILNEKRKIAEFGGDSDRFSVKVADGISEKYTALYQGYVLNHATFKLSDLDLEMIKAVPQGGNWKDIPEETVEKSKRLGRISQTGGRTTLYGRIDYDKPSYTITTYFNRPGNGTYVHPVHERVVSVREAARFQTFRDDYYFFGNKTQLLKQVGNAVPTVLAYQIGRAIVEKTGCRRSIDLFCGAGGMTVGFKAAGIDSLMSNDIEESACLTLKINNPEIPVLCGDITQEAVKAALEKAAKKGGADIICGGPPCQGFSMAGFRSADDPRNQLFREFVDVVRRVDPKVIIFENVEGLLSYQGGKTYQEVHKLFAELGYKTEGRFLMANEYAVPQRRKRVILICTKMDLGIDPMDLYPKAITCDEKCQVTARETIADLEDVACEKTAQYIEGEEGDMLQFLKGKISYAEYVQGREKIEAKKIRRSHR